VNDIALFARARSLIRLKLTSDQWRLREKTSHQFAMLEDDRPIMDEPADKARVLLVEDDARSSSGSSRPWPTIRMSWIVRANTAEAMADIDDPRVTI